jgi:hypothetical protein
MAEVVRTVVLTDEEAAAVMALVSVQKLSLESKATTPWEKHMLTVIETLDAKVRKARRWRRGR